MGSRSQGTRLSTSSLDHSSHGPFCTGHLSFLEVVLCQCLGAEGWELPRADLAENSNPH